MIIIGEKINGTRQEVAQAIRARDAAFIARLAREQVDAGSRYLDVNAGTAPDREPEDLAWLVRTVQAECEVPLCLDSANPTALRAALAVVDRTPMLNSVSGEAQRIAGVLPLALEHGTDLILLALDDDGIPATGEDRMQVVDRLVGLAVAGGLQEEKLFIDPLVTAISTGTNNALLTCDTIRRIKVAYPKAHITCGLSNISFGMPLRGLVNRTFLAMAVQAGLDSAIADPNDRELRETMLAAETLMGLDRYCLNFNKAFRAGRIGPRPD
ncbi:MAG: dihydropteroate synthase [Deferrisomatales bacterium]|nr:dihydropteroate synthase [Deferrisomatales bacterium]